MATKQNQQLRGLQAGTLTDNPNWQYLICLSSLGSAPRHCHLWDGVWKCVLDSVFVFVLTLTFPHIICFLLIRMIEDRGRSGDIMAERRQLFAEMRKCTGRSLKSSEPHSKYYNCCMHNNNIHQVINNIYQVIYHATSKKDSNIGQHSLLSLAIIDRNLLLMTTWMHSAWTVCEATLFPQ